MKIVFCGTGPGTPGLDFETWETTNADFSSAGSLPGAPGLDFETWETTNADFSSVASPQIAGAL